MKTALIISILATASAVTGAAVPGAATAPQDSTVRLTAGPDGLPLKQLVELAEQTLGIAFFYQPQDLRDTAIHFTGSLEIPADRFLGWFERILRENDFLHLEVGADDDALHSIRKIAGMRSAGYLKTLAPKFTPDEVTAMADRMNLVTTTIQVENLPPRDVVNTLQPFFADNYTEMIRHVDGTTQIVMTGLASSLASLIEMVRSMDNSASGPSDGTQPNLYERVISLERQLKTLQKKLDG
jgi:type II secretory pathway component GspD/PulD (secretin)